MDMLCEAVIEMAIDDIRKNNRYKEDAVNFLKSSYADCFLVLIGSNLKGTDILDILKEENNA